MKTTIGTTYFWNSPMGTQFKMINRRVRLQKNQELFDVAWHLSSFVTALQHFLTEIFAILHYDLKLVFMIDMAATSASLFKKLLNDHTA